MKHEPVIRMQNIGKSFPGVRALNDINIDFYPGEVHVLLGENGAGKSTLIKILSGVYQQDEGTFYYKGKEEIFHTPVQALSQGISTIHQELSVVPDLTVAENIFLGAEKRKHKLLLNKKLMNDEAEKYINKIGVHIDPTKIISELSIAEMQMVEIAKSISQNASVVIMDEPTASLSDHEVSSLFKIIRTLKEHNVAIIYISHRLQELFEIGDKITVIKDGEMVKTLDVAQTNEDELISLMVGREITKFFNKKTHVTDTKVLEVKNLCKTNCYKNISFSLNKGEVLGISGLVGAGRTEVLQSIFGAMQCDSGEILLHNKIVKIKSPSQAIKHKLGLVPENRKTQGVLVDETVMNNITLPNLRNNLKGIFLNKPWERKISTRFIKNLNIKTPSAETLVKNLSGGNQQKISLAKWLAANIDILLLDEPTHGIDVNAKAEIYSLINEYTVNGGSVLLVSSELPEILGICDRVVVMRLGEISKILPISECDEETIMKFSSN